MPPSPERMIVAPLNRVRRSAHAGMIVEGLDGARHTCGCVLSLVAHVGKSKVDELPSGHRIVSGQCWNVPFEPSTMNDTGAPDHADTKLEGQLASYCTMSTVQCYTLSSRQAKKPVYAMVLLGNAYIGTDGITYMVDKVRIPNDDRVSEVKSVMSKLCRLFLHVAPGKGGTPDSCWDGVCTPLQVKTSRRFGRLSDRRRPSVATSCFPLHGAPEHYNELVFLGY